MRKPHHNIKAYLLIQPSVTYNVYVDEWPFDEAEGILLQQVGDGAPLHYADYLPATTIAVYGKAATFAVARRACEQVYDLFYGTAGYGLTLPAPGYITGQELFVNQCRPVQLPTHITHEGDHDLFSFNLLLSYRES